MDETELAKKIKDLERRRDASAEQAVPIRPATLTDAQGIIDLLNPIIGEGSYTIMTNHLTLSAQEQWLRVVVEQGVCFVAAIGNKIVGIQSVEPISSEPALREVGDISTFVWPSMHRNKIGKRLADQTMRAAREMGFRKVMAMVRADNPRAIAYYESLGFVRIGIAREHARVQGGLVDEVFLERFLSK